MWQSFQANYYRSPNLGLSLDLSRLRLRELSSRSPTPSSSPGGQGERGSLPPPAMTSAFQVMAELEAGAIANPDEKRMVGHYWLRNPELAPTPEIGREIRNSVVQVKRFATSIHSGTIHPPTAPRFTRVLAIGIGGSALGPMFLADALGSPSTDLMKVDFVDNTDPDGIARLFAQLAGQLGETLCIVTSKSGGTPETRNGMILADHAYRVAGLEFAKHAVAITMPGSQLDRTASSEGWLERFPMFDWVGGRTSVLSAVGLLPAALQGLDIDGLLQGAARCDEATRIHDPSRNPAALLAQSWYHATEGKGLKDMVVLPYKDRLLLFARYLQQLIMESLGKEFDLNGNRVLQGLTVYGNKGSTDQHAYVQQLREGVPNFFVLFLRVLRSGGEALEVEPGITAGDYLHGFLLGTRAALFENGRESITLTLDEVDARSVGALIALFERAVGFYATLVGINAYHQPGVEAGKKAAASVLLLQKQVLQVLQATPQNAEQIADHVGAEPETVFLLLEHLVANGRARQVADSSPSDRQFARV